MLSILSMLSTALAERLLADAVKHKRIPTHSSLQWRQGYSASPGLRSRSNPFPAAASTALMAAVNGLHDASLTREAVAEALCSASLALLDQNAEEPWDLTRVAVGAAFDSGGSSKQRSSHGAGFMPAGAIRGFLRHTTSTASAAAHQLPLSSARERSHQGTAWAIAKHQGTGPLHDASLGNVAFNHRGIDIETCEDSSKGCSSPRQASVSCSGDRDTEQGAEPSSDLGAQNSASPGMITQESSIREALSGGAAATDSSNEGAKQSGGGLLCLDGNVIAEEAVCLDRIDVAEQQRILEDIERQRRDSIKAAPSSALTMRGRSTSSSGDPQGKKRLRHRMQPPEKSKGQRRIDRIFMRKK